MRKFIAMACAAMLASASGFALANDMDKHDSSNSDTTTSGSSNTRSNRPESLPSPAVTAQVTNITIQNVLRTDPMAGTASAGICEKELRIRENRFEAYILGRVLSKSLPP